MTDSTSHPLAVYRLLPRRGEFRTLLLGGSLRRLIRWQITGSATDLPTWFSASWDGNPAWRKGEFPSGYPGAPVLSRRVADLLAADLSESGPFVPIVIEAADPAFPADADAGGSDDYVLHLVKQTVDCLDARRSSKPKKTTGEITKAVFRPEALPVGLASFRVPEFRGGVYWNAWAVDLLTELLGDDLEARPVWSEDPAVRPHPNPWGF
ncbi:hypothetical protein ACFXAW_29640 [Streptomyces sp. NPDC059445]|uniref:hypothetical protein n=1 Tax=Streptomyces sp. NPDC059445 TaxID=3346832 RepID=UPI00368EFE31